MVVVVLAAWLLTEMTNSSVVYHWIRGQSLFKLYMIKAVIEISDMLFKGFGLGIIENFSRDFYMQAGNNSAKGVLVRLLDIIAMTLYVWIHSFVLVLEMFTLHVALTSSEDSILSFLFYNNFAELKITVFKKVDVAGLYQYACNDGVERLQYSLYLANILMSTS